jgi:hypothetical protein
LRFIPHFNCGRRTEGIGCIERIVVTEGLVGVESNSFFKILKSKITLGILLPLVSNLR